MAPSTKIGDCLSKETRRRLQDIGVKNIRGRVEFLYGFIKARAQDKGGSCVFCPDSFKPEELAQLERLCHIETNRRGWLVFKF